MAEGQVFHVKFKPGVSLDKRFEQIVALIVDCIEDGMRDQFVRQKALSIIGSRGIAGHDEINEIRAITQWVKANLRYVKEPVGVEIFHTARRLIKDIEQGKGNGDCDDFVILAGALLGSIGYPVGALIVDSSGNGVYNHVMLVTKTFTKTKEFGNDWIPIELIYPDFEMGESVPVSKIYPLMAEARNIRAPVAKQAISGLRGLNPFKGHVGDIGSGRIGITTDGVPATETDISNVESIMGPQRLTRNGVSTIHHDGTGFKPGELGSMNKDGRHIPRGNSAMQLLQAPKYKDMGDIDWTTGETWGVLISGATVGVMSVLLFNRFYR